MLIIYLFQNHNSTIFIEPSIYPRNIHADRINDTAFNIVWDPLTLVEARGFVINYTIELRPQQSRTRQLQDPNVIMETVPHNVSEVIITNLDSNLNYEYSVTVRTNGGQISSPFQPLIDDIINIATSCICFPLSMSESMLFSTTRQQLSSLDISSLDTSSLDISSSTTTDIKQQLSSSTILSNITRIVEPPLLAIQGTCSD